MNRATRDKFVSHSHLLTDAKSLWETPPQVYQQLVYDFGPFDLDLTADSKRHLEPVWLGPGSPIGHVDALVAPWFELADSGYSNPPYGWFAAAMIKKAHEEAKKGFTSTLLLPMRVTKQFRKHVLHGAAQLIFPDKRICFYENGAPRWNEEALKKGGYQMDPALFDSIIVRFKPGMWIYPRVSEWKVPPHYTPPKIG